MYIEAHRNKYRVAKMAKWIGVSRSGYYAWRKRHPSMRDLENQKLLELIRQIWKNSKEVYGSKKITEELQKRSEEPINHKRVERIMRDHGIRSKVIKKYKATTNSNHSLPVAPNILNRDFHADAPGQKMVSDITYIPTDEGWLYLAGVMDLCGEKIVGVSMDARMTKQLAINALQDAINHTAITKGCILHSDRGSQYCSHDYQKLAREHGFISSMSRKGNCLDNAVMENFFGILKSELLYLKEFDSLEQFKQELIEYLDYYNNRRIKAKLKGLPPAVHRKQALHAA